jgi:hypothetical protein
MSSSKLSSMLVHEGVLSMKDLEEVFARQVILGGLLDTLLLERALVPEATLVTMLAAATGLPALCPEHLLRPASSAESPAPFDEATALRLGVCPLPSEEGQLLVLVSESTDLVALEELAFELGRPATVVIGPEVRLFQARQRVYGSALSARFAAVLKKVGELAPQPATLKMSAPAAFPAEDAPPSTGWGMRTIPSVPLMPVVVDAPPGPPPALLPPIQEPPAPVPPTGDPPVDRARAAASAAPEAAALSEMPPIPDDAEEEASAEEGLIPAAELHPDEFGPGAHPESLTEKTDPSARPLVYEAVEERTVPSARPLLEVSVPIPGPTTGRSSYSELKLSCTPLSVEEASSAMSSANNRDELLFSLACGAHRHLDVVQVYALKGHQMVGQFELNSGLLDTTEIRGRAIDLNIPSVVSRSATEGMLYIGPVPDTDASPSILFTAGILEAKMVALVPVLLKGRPICQVIGHCKSRSIPMTIRGPLAQLAEEAALALAALIIRQKQRAAFGAAPSTAATPPAARGTLPGIAPTTPGEPVSPDPAPAVAAPPDAAATPAPLWSGEPLYDELTPTPVATEIATAPKRYLGPPRSLEREPSPVEDLIEALERGGPSTKQAEERLLSLGKGGIEALVERFPGALRFDRTTLGNLLPPVGECSTLLRALLSFGRPAISSIAPLLHHHSVDTRFYAAYILSELVYPESVALLATCLQDRDLDVRRIAIRTLHKYSELSRFKDVLEELRHDLSNPEPRPRKAAIEALAAMGDSASVPILVEMLSDADRGVARAALEGLVSLTKRDFSLNRREWLAWWELSRNRHRIEWLIDGLLHADSGIRESSVIELEALSGLRLGFRREMPRGELEVMRNRYIEWWNVEGSRLYGSFH